MIGKHFQRATLVLKEEFKTVWKKTRDTIIQNSVSSCQIFGYIEERK